MLLRNVSKTSKIVNGSCLCCSSDTSRRTTRIHQEYAYSSVTTCATRNKPQQATKELSVL